MSVVAEEPPEDADDWTEDQWLEWLASVPADPESGHTHPLTRAASTRGGTMLGAAMFGLEQAIYGERAKPEIVAEADANGSDEADIELDEDDPAASRITIDPTG